MVSKYFKTILFLPLWTKFSLGSEEAIDFLASFSDQSKNGGRVPDVLELIVQPKKLEKSWLSLGSSNSIGDSNAKLMKKAEDSNKFTLSVIGEPKNCFTHQSHRKPVYQEPQLNEYSWSTTTEMVANYYSAKHPTKPGGNCQSTVNSGFETTKILNVNKEKPKVSEIEQECITQKGNKHSSTVNRSEVVLERVKSDDVQSVVKKISEKNSNKRKRRYANSRKGLSEAEIESIFQLKKLEELHKRLMKLLDPDSSLINLNFVQECILGLQRATGNQMGDSMFTNLYHIIRQMTLHGGAEFYITLTEANAFFTIPTGVSFKVKFNSNINANRRIILSRFQIDFKRMIEPMNFENLVKQFYQVCELRPPPKSKLIEWQGYDEEKNTASIGLRNKMYIGKVFLIYSVVINKIFCNGPKDEGIIRHQREAIEFYDSICDSAEIDETGNFFIKENKFQIFLQSQKEKSNLEKLFNKFNTSLAGRNFIHLDRYLFSMAMILIEIWLSLYRTDLYRKINSGIMFNIRFKPFLNSIFEILLQISG
ncbi:hypothetical protein BY996DRAFT_7107601 [Phakopsora pachyrhizi]|nr:hypothetical protein BY996DRAFT_7107601 [Phakopsora pachyrhizi]